MDMKTLGIGLLALSLSLSACKKSGENAESGETETEATETETTETETEQPAEPEVAPEPEKPTEPEVAAADAAADAEVAAAPVDESLFIKAYYEVTCVQTKVDDMGKQKEIIAEILPRYGFDQGSFDAAKAQLDSKENVKLALTERMKSCTKEVAMAFVTAGGQVEAPDMAPDMVEDMAEDMGKPKVVKPQPAYVGKLFARGLAAGDIVQTELMLNIQKDYLVLGSFKGLRDGKRFTISLRGNVDKSGTMVLRGTMGQNQVGLRGNLTKSGATGSLDGQIYGKAVNARFNAPK